MEIRKLYIEKLKSRQEMTLNLPNLSKEQILEINALANLSMLAIYLGIESVSVRFISEFVNLSNSLIENNNNNLS